MKKILVVEDEIMTSLDLLNILNSNGYKVAERVHTGESAVSAFKRHDPDVVIMDVHLKGKMTGIDAAKEIVQFANPFFIFMSGDEYDMYLRDTGIRYKYLRKPILPEELVSSLEAICLQI